MSSSGGGSPAASLIAHLHSLRTIFPFRSPSSTVSLIPYMPLHCTATAAAEEEVTGPPASHLSLVHGEGIMVHMHNRVKSTADVSQQTLSSLCMESQLL